MQRSYIDPQSYLFAKSFQAELSQVLSTITNVSAKTLPKCFNFGPFLLLSHALLLPPCLVGQNPTRFPPIMLERDLSKEYSGDLPLGNV